MKKGFKLFVSVCLAFFATLVLAACANHKPEQAMSQVKLLIQDIYDKNERFDDNNTSLGSFVNSDISLPFSTKVDGEEFVISYSLTEVSDEQNTKLEVKADTKEAKVAITQTGEEQSFKLNVKIEKQEASWSFKVDKLDLSMEVTQAEVDAKKPMDSVAYAKAADKSDVYVQGWITSAHDYSSNYGNGSVWLQDEKGGFYGYRVVVGSQREWDTYFKVGNKITLKGKISRYKGWQEIGQGCTYEYIKDAQPKQFDYVDQTNLLTDNKSNSEKALALQNTKVSLTAKVLSIPQYDQKEMVLKVKLGVNEYSVFVKKNYVGKIDNNLFNDLQIGYTIKLNGITSVKEELQICPESNKFYEITSTEVTDADKLASAVAAVKDQSVKGNYATATEIALMKEFKTSDGVVIPVTYEYVADTKSEGNGIVLDAAAGKLTISPNGTQKSKGKLVATVKHAELDAKTVEFEVETKLDTEVFNEVKKSIEDGIDFPPVISESNLLNRFNLPSTTVDGATVTYAFDEACKVDAEAIFKLGKTEVSKRDFIDVIAAPTNESVKTLKLVATVTYQNQLKDKDGKFVNTQLTEKIETEIKVIKTLKPATEDELKVLEEKFEAAKDGAKDVEYEGVVTLSSSKKGYVVIENKFGATTLFLPQNSNCDKLFPLNALVHAKGEKDNYNGLKQLRISSTSDMYVIALDQPRVKATDITEKVKTGADLLPDQSRLVKMTGAIWTGSNFLVGDNSMNWRVEKNIFDYDNSKLVIGGIYTVEGYLTWYKQAQIVPINKYATKKTGDCDPQKLIEILAVVHASNIDNKFAYSKTSYTFPALEGYTVTYELAAGAPAGIALNADKNGLVLKAGDTVQTATLKFTIAKDGLNPSTGEVVITLGKLNSVMFNVSENFYISETKDNSKQLGLEKGFTVKVANNDYKPYEASNTGAYIHLKDNVIKLYGNKAGNGAQLNISHSSKKFTKVVISVKVNNTNSTAEELKVLTGDQQVQVNKLTKGFTQVEINFATPVNEFALQNIAAGAKSTQVWIQSIDFTFAA